MKIEQIYTSCLAQGAHYIESNDQVAIIDPLREVQPYIDKATANNAQIKYIFETHFYADLTSGHVALSQKIGVLIIDALNANTTFESIIAQDNQEFKLGKITIVALHTPGHTMESTTYLLHDENGKDHAIFSGLDGGFTPWVGTLIGNVKQPILLVVPNGREKETIIRLARVGFDNTLGYLKGGFEAWKNDVVNNITATKFKNKLDKKIAIFDVRNSNELELEHINEAINTTLSFLHMHLKDFHSNKSFYTHYAEC